MEKLTIKLGKEKEIEVSPWKAKAKKDFIKLFRLKGEKVTDVDIVNTLITPYLEDDSMYISGDEYQKILVEIRKESISSEIDFNITCEECSEDSNIKINLNDVSHFRENKYTIEINDVVWKDIQNKRSLKEAIKKYSEEPPKNLEMFLHIDSIKGVKIESLEQMMNIYDEMTLPEANKLEEDFEKVKSKIEFYSDIKCPACGFVKKYEFDVLPTFYDPLLPKNM